MNRLAMLQMLDAWKPRRPRVVDWFERIKSRANFEPAVDKWLPEKLANDMRTNGPQCWPRIETVLKAA